MNSIASETLAERFDRSMVMAQQREAARIAANRVECLSECTGELKDTIANVEQHLGHIAGLEARLEALQPERLAEAAKNALRTATASGDTKAASAAAATLNAIANGTGAEAVERITTEAALQQARADMAEVKASAKRAETAALKVRLEALEKDLERAVKGYQDSAQIAYDRAYLLRGLGRKYLKFEAAARNWRISENLQAIERSGGAIELPTVFVPGHGLVSPVAKGA